MRYGKKNGPDDNAHALIINTVIPYHLYHMPELLSDYLFERTDAGRAITSFWTKCDSH